MEEEHGFGDPPGASLAGILCPPRSLSSFPSVSTLGSLCPCLGAPRVPDGPVWSLALRTPPSRDLAYPYPQPLYLRHPPRPTLLLPGAFPDHIALNPMEVQ